MPFYIAAQVLGSIAASFALKGIFHPYMHGGVTFPEGTDWPSFALEFIISFNLMFVVTAVATDTRAVSLPSNHRKILNYNTHVRACITTDLFIEVMS